MGRDCIELWTDVHYVLKMIVLGLLLSVNYFVLDSYSKYHRFYAFGNGHFFAALINVVLILYGYTWFETTLIWEASMNVATILMLVISTFAFTYDYYHEEEYIAELNMENYLRYDTRSFAISAGLTTASIVLLVIDFVLVVLDATGKFVLRGRSRQVTRFGSTFF